MKDKHRGKKTVISYHSAGEVIFWWWYQEGEIYALSREIRDIIIEQTGYSPIAPNEKMAGLGFKDWFIEVYNKPGFTIEIGKTVNQRPLKWEEFEKIWKANRDIPINVAYKLSEKIIKEEDEQIKSLLNQQKWPVMTLKEYEEIYIRRYIED